MAEDQRQRAPADRAETNHHDGAFPFGVHRPFTHSLNFLSSLPKTPDFYRRKTANDTVLFSKQIEANATGHQGFARASRFPIAASTICKRQGSKPHRQTPLRYGAQQ